MRKRGLCDGSRRPLPTARHRAAGDTVDGLAAALHNLADTLADMAKPDPAQGAHEGAVEIYRKLADPRPDLALGYEHPLLLDMRVIFAEYRWVCGVGDRVRAGGTGRGRRRALRDGAVSGSVQRAPGPSTG